LMIRAVVAQRLVPRADGKGRVAAMEIMLNTPRIQALIRRGELETMRQAIEEGVNEGLQTMDQAPLKLYQGKKITQEAALQFADSPTRLGLRIKGIKEGESRPPGVAARAAPAAPPSAGGEASSGIPPHPTADARTHQVGERLGLGLGRDPVAPDRPVGLLQLVEP